MRFRDAALSEGAGTGLCSNHAEVMYTCNEIIPTMALAK